MAIDKERVLDALRTVAYPGFRRDVVSLGVVRDVGVEGGTVELRLAGDPRDLQALERPLRDAVSAVDGVSAVRLSPADRPSGSPSLQMAGARRPSPAADGAATSDLIPGVRRTIAVASGKGGVGKSTVAVNLAVALARRGSSVGLLDADIYGPSIPTMMGLRTAQPRFDPATRRLVPFERFGVRFMSLGFLVDPDQAVIWRGPMVMKALEQLLRDVEWGELDVLVVDMPPGTGDAQLTLSQRVQLAGAVVVTTPQDVALADAIKGVAMFRRVSVPVLGIVENMSYFECPHCHERADVFGHGGGAAEARRLGVPLLGEIPLDAAVRTSGDVGEPVAAADPPGTLTHAFLELADRVSTALVAEPPAAAREGRGGNPP